MNALVVQHNMRKCRWHAHSLQMKHLHIKLSNTQHKHKNHGLEACHINGNRPGGMRGGKIGDKYKTNQTELVKCISFHVWYANKTKLQCVRKGLQSRFKWMSSIPNTLMMRFSNTTNHEGCPKIGPEKICTNAPAPPQKGGTVHV